jgi:hypothetical protein
MPWWHLGGEEVLILDLSTRWGWVVSVTPRPRFAPGKGSPVPIVQETGWAPEPVWTQRLEEKFFAPVGDGTPIAWSSSPLSDTILTELPQLLFLSTVICKTWIISGGIFVKPIPFWSRELISSSPICDNLPLRCRICAFFCQNQSTKQTKSCAWHASGSLDNIC